MADAHRQYKEEIKMEQQAGYLTEEQAFATTAAIALWKMVHEGWRSPALAEDMAEHLTDWQIRWEYVQELADRGLLEVGA